MMCSALLEYGAAGAAFRYPQSFAGVTGGGEE